MQLFRIENVVFILFFKLQEGKSKQLKSYVTKEWNRNPNYAAICRANFNDYHRTIFIGFESFRKPTCYLQAGLIKWQGMALALVSRWWKQNKEVMWIRDLGSYTSCSLWQYKANEYSFLF